VRSCHQGTWPVSGLSLLANRDGGQLTTETAMEKPSQGRQRGRRSAAADKAEQVGDHGSNDILVSDVLRTNELQTWFIAEHLVDTPLVRV
jgi:hypothetical protein